MGLIFYDTKTTGTETSFDQILQFAGIQTDEEFHEIDRFAIRCRLLPHVVPSPRAMTITGMGVAQLTDPAIHSHYQMVRAICAKLQSWSPALFVGWNSIDFDEHLIRQALYKTLHNPYLTSRDGNSRSDVMRIAQACSLFAPDSLIFPKGPDGEKIFELDHIAAANGFKYDNVRDAMGDVEATIFICRLLSENAPEVWSAFMRFSKKAAVVDYIQAESIFCLNNFYNGKPFSWIVTAIGQNEKNQPEWYVYNLEIAPESLMPFSEDDLAKRLGELPKPVRRLKSNAVPILFPADVAPKICKGRNCGLDELQRRADVIQADVAFKARLISAFESKNEPYPASRYVEQQIYNGFVQKEDEKLMNDFHRMEWHKRPAIVEKFKDPRLKEIGRKLIHIERPDLLDEPTRREIDLALFRRIMGIGEEIPWLTLPRALEDFGAVKANADAASLQRLLEHEQYLQQRLEQAQAYLNDQPHATA